MKNKQDASEKFVEWSQKIEEIRVTDKITSLAFEIISISNNTLLRSTVKRWKMSANDFCEISLSTVVTRYLISATSVNRRPFRDNLRWKNKKKYAGAKSGE